jgi:hypothetical protein
VRNRKRPREPERDGRDSVRQRETETVRDRQREAVRDREKQTETHVMGHIPHSAHTPMHHHIAEPAVPRCVRLWGNEAQLVLTGLCVLNGECGP